MFKTLLKKNKPDLKGKTKILIGEDRKAKKKIKEEENTKPTKNKDSA